MLYHLENLLQAFDFSSFGGALLRVAAVFLCLTVHETCHGLAAYALGDPTAKSMHRLSINPLRHIDWFGFAMMFAAGFGWAKPVPVNPRYFKKPKQGMAITALAGPASNFLLTCLLLAICKVILLYGPDSFTMEILFYFSGDAARLSLGLGIFNLIPIPPLDGSKVLAVLLPDQAYSRLMYYERYGILVLLVLSFLGVGNGFIGYTISYAWAALLNLFGF